MPMPILQASGIVWPVPAELTDDILERRLFCCYRTNAPQHQLQDSQYT
jgi:hypothetical protein